MIVQSGNDACVVLAEGLAGSEAAFVEEMNREAKEIGLTRQPFRQCRRAAEPGSLDDGARSRDRGGPHDQGLPGVLRDLRREGIHLSTSITQGNRNPLLYKDLGADGLKTGHTEEAGYSLVGSAKRGDRRVLVVLSGLPSSKARAQESERLIEWAFREYNTVPAVRGRRHGGRGRRCGSANSRRCR